MRAATGNPSVWSKAHQNVLGTARLGGTHGEGMAVIPIRSPQIIYTSGDSANANCYLSSGRDLGRVLTFAIISSRPALRIY
jgi:hypothetical protein